MENVSQIVQKVRQANWRVQRQWIGLFLLGLVAISMVAGLYLNITVQATLAGREAQILRPTLVSEKRINSDLETQLAAMTSVEAMQERASPLGLRPAVPEDILYVYVEGYTPKTAVDMSRPVPTSQSQFDKPAMLSEYTESLFDWLIRKLAASASLGVQP